MRDGCGRRIDYLRISITDRCNIRCVYCMPEGGIPAMGHGDILRYEEIERIVSVMARLGIRHLRLTGGEPMVRGGCLAFVARLSNLPGIESVSMTSNGSLLCGRMEEAARAGLAGLNLSLDSLVPEVYSRLTRGGNLEDALTSLEQALAAGIRTKINVVPIQGVNDGELVSLAGLAKELPVAVRFIELMPIGCARGLCPVPRSAVMERLSGAYGELYADRESCGHGPAEYVRPSGFAGSLGFISAVSHEFCQFCNRVRLTADGRLKLCLNHERGLDLRRLLRDGADDAALVAAILDAVARKPLRHNFFESGGDLEWKNMNEIGG